MNSASDYIDSIGAMAEAIADSLDAPERAKDPRCKAIAAKFRACITRHNIGPGEYEGYLEKLETGAWFVRATAFRLHRAGIPALELWAIVKSTLEGKS